MSEPRTEEHSHSSFIKTPKQLLVVVFLAFAVPIILISPAPAATKGGDAAKGKSVFDTTCSVCHGPGIAGAPKAGDKAAWAPRLKQGVAALHEVALKGKGAMPPKGGNNALSESDVKAAVDYMLSLVK